MKIPVYDIWEGSTMEESSPSQNHNGQLGSSTGAINAANKPSDDSNQRLQYSIPGILHFIQHEWARFEVERSQWEVDRAELQARIAFLQGERNGQENLKNDLVRRIKMLEYALKQERAKFHKLKYGTELNQGELVKVGVGEGGADEAEVAVAVADVEAPFTSVSNISWKQGRQLLRQYLQEIGYTDTIIDVRSNRVRSLLGLNNNEETVVGGVGGQATAKRALDNQGRATAKKVQSGGSALAEAMILETEAAVMANFDFLAQADVEMDDDEDGGGGGSGSGSGSDDPDADDIDERDEMRLKRATIGVRTKMEPDDVDADAEEFLNELNLLSDVPVVYPGQEGGGRRMVGVGGEVVGEGEEEALGIISDGGALGLGELARLTVNNEAEAAYDLPSTKESLRKTWNAKYTLRSHFDGVRALAFHPQEPVLITASEDHTLKLWNLQKTVPAKKSASLDVEPLYTFRCHTGPVLCLAMSAQGDRCYSGATDATIHCWNLPSANIDPYDSFEVGVLGGSLVGHSDSVWGLSVDWQRGHLLSCSADATVKLWTPHNYRLLASFTSQPDGVPTSMDFVRDEGDKMVAAYNTGDCILFDLETTKPILRLDTSQDGSGGGGGGRQINRVVCHPTLPLTVSAHEDRHIRFLDHNSGKTVHSMVAHLDAVTSLAVDPNGLYLLSGSHDCSIRLWNLDNKTCVQEITAHRKKFDESILDVAFHPSRPYIASAGADALAKVFV